MRMRMRKKEEKDEDEPTLPRPAAHPHSDSLLSATSSLANTTDTAIATAAAIHRAREATKRCVMMAVFDFALFVMKMKKNKYLKIFVHVQNFKKL